MNFQRHPFDPLIMRRREMKARDIRLGITLKMGGVVTDTNCQRASQSLYETIAVSLFARLPPRALVATSSLARDSCSATFPPRIFEQKRDCSQSDQNKVNPSLAFNPSQDTKHTTVKWPISKKFLLKIFLFNIERLGYKTLITILFNIGLYLCL